jgi:hypothetical protein
MNKDICTVAKNHCVSVCARARGGGAQKITKCLKSSESEIKSDKHMASIFVTVIYDRYIVSKHM